MNSLEALRQSQFILTKEYRKFLEFCEACRRERYLGMKSPSGRMTFRDERTC